MTAVGRVAKVGAPARTTGNGNRDPGVTLTIRAPFKGVRRGESVAVNGACLTVDRVVRGGFTVHAVTTTIARTLLGEYAVGRRVNLERALRATDRLGGHLVQGHVDGVATVVSVAAEADAVLVDLRVPAEVGAVTIPRGSITVDGVSLTVHGRPGSDRVRVALIPFTRAHTTLGRLAVGDRVHVEGDVLAKYVGQLCRSEP
ncbi:MAG: riboflavin synthase [Gemmatimonadales bacterium]